MNKLFYLSLSMVALLQLGCTKEDSLPKESVLASLKFIRESRLRLNNVTSTVEDTVEVKAELVLENKKWVLRSDNLEEVAFINSETGEMTYGYRYKSTASTASPATTSSSAKTAVVYPEGDWSISRGYYGFNGYCFVYGTLIVVDGQEFFEPADWQTRATMPNICPPAGTEYADLPLPYDASIYLGFIKIKTI